MNLLRNLAMTALASGCLASTSAQALSVEFLGPSQVVAGNSFSLDVVVSGVFDTDPYEELLAFGFNVAVGDSNLATLTGTSVSAPFDDDSAMFPETGVAGSTFEGIASGTSEPIRLARLDFNAGPSTGFLSISATGLASDPNQGLFLVSAGQVGFSAATQVEILAVPEPETYAMLLAGLGILAASVRRRMS